jgi:ParB/RepB/Spo0J family partition protein
MAEIPVTLIDMPPVLLRPVDRLSVEYIELRDSIAEHGVLSGISVRPIGDRFQVIDGMYRLNCAIDLGLETIPATIKHGVTDADLPWLQIQANACRFETTPIQYAEHLKRLMRDDPSLTIGDVSARLHKNPAWIKNQLRLLWLPREVQQLVDDGVIPLGNAYLLAKIPYKRDYVEQAKRLPVREFKQIAAAVIKQFTEQIRQGKLDEHFTNDFKPQAHVRLLREIEAEMEARCEGPRVLMQEGAQTHIDGFYAALKWVLHLDLNSIEEQKQKFLKNFRKEANGSESNSI